jgi:hypothetical protein
MITAQGLQLLGFTAEVDFSLMDNLDDKGVFIKEWNSDKPQPSVSDIEAAHTVWQAEFDSQQYARDRASAYPSLQDQADMAYWDRKNGTTTLDDAITAVKAAYPKT